MQTKRPQLLERRRMLQTIGATGALAVAGCLGDDSEPTDDDENGTNGDDQTTDTDDEDNEDANEQDQGTLAALVEEFDDRVFNDAQYEIEGENRNYTPAHVWKWVSDETFIALHVDDPNPEQAEELLYIVIGKKGAFTEESKPGEEFSHFHSYEADSWEAGHGAGGDGYWLTHIAVQEHEMPWGTVEVGVDYEFMPTPPEESDGTNDFEVGTEGSLSDAERERLLELFDDDWTSDDQREIEGEDRSYTPAHVWWKVNENAVVFLHWDDPNPEEASDLLYFGMGQAGNFTAVDIPHEDDYTHFHMWEADSWDAGHGGQSEDDEGYWLIHHAVREHEMPWGTVDIGVDREFMPTPVE